MKGLWISSLAWMEDNKYKYPVNGPGAVSGSLFQQSIIEGLEKNGMDLDILSDYPGIKRFSKRFKWSHNGKASNQVVTSINIPIVSLFIKTINLFIYVLRMNKKNEYNIAIGYLIHSPYLLALWFIKKINKNVKTVLICPDLPGYMDMSLDEKPLKRVLKKLDAWIINKSFKNIDSYILFSDAMSEKLPIGNKPKIVIEGVYSPLNLDLTLRKKNKVIMHAGTLHKNIGIENIIQAFELINDSSLELWIFGDGELKDYIKEAAIRDKRIKFLGFVSRGELFEYQKKSMLLINARNPIDEYTKYSFPSKTFEYMVSATPFLTTKLEGIPNEYYEFMYTVDSNKPDELSARMVEVLNKNSQENIQFGLKAREFIINNKNNIAQAQKIKKFFQYIID